MLLIDNAPPWALMGTIGLVFWLYSIFNSPRKRHGFPVAGYRSVFEPGFLVKLRFTLNGVPVLQDAYDKYIKKLGVPCWIRRNDMDLLMMPPRYAEEIASYTRFELSSADALTYNLLGKHNNIDLFSHSDLHVRVLRSYITANLSQVMLNAREELDNAWNIHLPKAENWEEVNIIDCLYWMIARMYARLSVGYPICQDEKYIQATMDHFKDVFQLVFLIHLFPKWMAPILIPLCPQTRRVSRYQAYAAKVMKPIIEQGGPTEGNAKITLLHGMLKEAKSGETSQKDIALRQMILSMAAIHTMGTSVTYCLMELCRHPEIIPELTKEAVETTAENPDWIRHAAHKLPKMDSFISEVGRFHPAQSFIPQRRAKVPITLKDGTQIPVGTQLGFPQLAVHSDSDLYDDPHTFDAMRNYRRRVKADIIGKSSKGLATTPAPDYLVFGHGPQACPGRYFAVSQMKLVLSRFLLEFEFKESEGQRHKKLWSSFEEMIVVNPNLRLMVRRK